MIRTYRTTVRGRFIDLDDSQRTSLREAQEDPICSPRASHRRGRSSTHPNS